MSTQDQLGINRNSPRLLPESREMTWKSEQQRTSLVEHPDSNAGLPGIQQKQTSQVGHHAGIIAKSSR